MSYDDVMDQFIVVWSHGNPNLPLTSGFPSITSGGVTSGTQMTTGLGTKRSAIPEIQPTYLETPVLKRWSPDRRESSAILLKEERTVHSVEMRSMEERDTNPVNQVNSRLLCPQIPAPPSVTGYVITNTTSSTDSNTGGGLTSTQKALVGVLVPLAIVTLLVAGAVFYIKVYRVKIAPRKYRLEEDSSTDNEKL